MKVFYVMRYCLLLLLTLSVFAVQAQTGSISGKIIDETGQGLPGASVIIKGTTRSASTDVSGNFRIAAVTNGTVTLTASYIGYKSIDQIVTVKGNTVVSFNLVPDAQNLNEVVVIGYGSAQKKDLTGSITTVSAKDFQKGNITSPEQLIAGKVAGVSITPNGGQPGAGSTIRIRGGASLNASNDPLVVIDGVPFSGNKISGSASPLSLVNPNDIETFTVLKDANATAIYGSRASNGVILITTKKGSSGEPKIDFSTVNSYSTVAKTVDVLTGDQVRAYVNANGNAAQKALLGTANTDWQDVIYDNAFATDNNLSIGGSFKNVPYRISAGYLDQRGLLLTDRLKRGSGGITLNPTFFDKHLKVDLNLKGTISESRFANQDAVNNAVQFDPTQPVYADNKYGGYFEWVSTSGLLNPNAPKNPLALLEQRTDEGQVNRSYGNLKLDYSFHFLPELHANANVGYDVSKGFGTNHIPYYAAQSFASSGTSTQYESTQNNKLVEFYLNYNKDLKGINSNINATAGYGFYDNKTTNYNFTSYNDLGGVTGTPVFPYDIQQNRLLSYYGRVVYTLANKYILSGTMRADGSSKFSPDNRWGYFPSVGLTWRAIDESFLKESKVFSDLKVRLSYGITGQQDGDLIGNYSYLANYQNSINEGQYQFGNQFYHLYTPVAYDKNLKWETSETYNAGIDYGFFNGRVNGSVDVYYKKTKDLLSTVPISVGTNFSNQLTTNVGNMENKGIELNVNVAIIKSADVNWDMGFNASYNKNKVTNLSLNPDPSFKVAARGITGATGTQLEWHTIDNLPYSFYVYKQVYDASGAPIEGVYADLNNDGIVNDQDLYFYKSPAPTYVLGFSTSFNYKKWTLSTVLRGNIGNYIYDNVSSNLAISSNILSTNGIINNAPSTIYEADFSKSYYQSDFYVHNASFLKMDNAGLTYNVGRLSPNSTANLRITANVQNVFIVSKYKGLDPESSTGIDYKVYPRPRTYSLGVNVGF